MRTNAKELCCFMSPQLQQSSQVVAIEQSSITFENFCGRSIQCASLTPQRHVADVFARCALTLSAARLVSGAWA